jgi:hypothetical protein
LRCAPVTASRAGEKASGTGLDPRRDRQTLEFHRPERRTRHQVRRDRRDRADDLHFDLGRASSRIKIDHTDRPDALSGLLVPLLDVGRTSAAPSLRRSKDTAASTDIA